MPYKDPETRRAKQREYQRKHYESNKQYYIDKATERRIESANEVRQLKESSPCMDCGIFYPHYVMDYDHRPGVEKIDSPSQVLANKGLAAFMAEIEKCDLVCANCHRARTHTRRNDAG